MKLFRNAFAYLLTLSTFSCLPLCIGGTASVPTSAVPKSAVPTFAGLTQEDDPAEKSALPSAEEVLDRYIQKLGGYEQLESRQNVHWVSSGTTNRGETFIFESYQAEGKFHSQFTYDDGRTRARNVRTDGTLNEDGIRAGVAWELRDGVSIRVIKDAELQEYIRRRTFVCSTTTLLDNYKSVECQSIEEVHDELTYKVHLLDHDGTVIDLYFSIDTGLLMRRVAVEEFGGRKQLVTRDRHNWEKLGDTMIARDQTVSHEGVVYNYHVETYEIDVRIPKEIFETPNMILEMQEKSKKAVEPKKEPNAKAVDSSKD